MRKTKPHIQTNSRSRPLRPASGTLMLLYMEVSTTIVGAVIVRKSARGSVSNAHTIIMDQLSNNSDLDTYARQHTNMHSEKMKEN